MKAKFEVLFQMSENFLSLAFYRRIVTLITAKKTGTEILALNW
jgi:hypothetical protein